MVRGRSHTGWWLIGIAAVAGALPACQLWQRAQPTLPTIVGAQNVGTERCLECHDEVLKQYQGTPHVAVLHRADGCETCHGPGSKHAESTSPDDIVGTAALRALGAPSRSALCLRCHERDVPQFQWSEHATAAVSCWDCHAEAFHKAVPEADAAPILPMRADPQQPGMRDEPWISARHGQGELPLCYRCHAQVSADFMLQFHHPVPEGRMRCTECHAVHGEARNLALDRENSHCLSCHSEMRGPFIFEHLALEDGCVACHSPHGSIVEKLLTQDNNGLCQQCHFDANYPLIGSVDHTGFLSGGARCWDCHFQIHGSNTNENFMPLRGVAGAGR